MGLSLVVGPAHSGKVALLLERYLESLDRDPWLVVPNRGDIDRVERDLVVRRPALLSGTIGTFDDLFRHVAGDDGVAEASDVQRALAARRALTQLELEELGPSAGTAGFPDTLLATIGELESGLVAVEQLDGDLGRLLAAYRDELARRGLRDRDRVRRDAVERLRADLDAWGGAPVFAYGFEDLTGAEWALVETLAARTDVTVSIPYEPGRAAFAALERTVEDLAELAHGAIEELPRSPRWTTPAALAHLELELFTDEPAVAHLDGAIRFLEAAGSRGTAELVASEVASLVRGGTRAEAVGIVCESPDRWRAPLEAALAQLHVPYAVESRLRLGDTTLGRSLLALLRFAWRGGSRGDLFAYLRSPYSGIERRSVDFVEGRLRGRAISDPARVEEESEKLRDAPIPALVELGTSPEPVSAVRAVSESMMRSAWGLDSPPVADEARADARTLRALERALSDLEGFADAGSAISADETLAALERTTVAPDTPASGRVAILDHERARTRTFEAVFVLGLEEGVFPRRARPSPLLSDDLRRELGGRLERPDSVARDRYLFYTTCARASRRLFLAREAAGDEGVPREPSPFWDDVRSLFEDTDVQRVTRRRSLSALTWPLESAPSERERLRALVRLAAEDRDGAAALASANDWSRRLDRAQAAFDRPTELRGEAALGPLSQKSVFSATELERFSDCSSAWLFERVIDPKRIDAEPDPLLRGQVLHTTLNRFYANLPRELDSERVTPENVDAAIVLAHRCLDEALESGVRLELTDLQAAELRYTLRTELEGFVRDEAQSGVEFVPRRLEVAFGSDRAAPELQRGLALDDGIWLSGKIDRIDVDPFSARGIVQDYKSGKGAHSAREIDRELRLQIPLYVLALRDLVGIEPLGGVYRALAGRRLTRGMLRESAREDLPGFAKDDYLDEDSFWSQIESARERAAENAGRIRVGDVRHDPKGDGCPAWCDLWPMCRVKRA